jgi:hypothetical protein
MGLNKKFFIQSAAAAAIPENPDAFYELNNNGNDSSGNGYNLTNYGVTYSTGNFGQAASFNASNDALQSSSLGTAYRNQTTFSWSFWVKTSGNSSGSAVNSMISFSDTGEGSTETLLYFRGIEGDKVVLSNRDNGTATVSFTGSTSIDDNVWHHIVFIASSSGTQLYVDGTDDNPTYGTGSSSTQVSMPNDLNMFTIGGNQDSGGRQWGMSGLIDQVRIYPVALTQEEVTALYNETA